MKLLAELSAFLEQRLDEFLKAHPTLELSLLDEELRQEEANARRTLADLQGQQQRLEAEIMATAQEIKRWYERTGKAKAAGRDDLAQGAQARQDTLLQQGNQQWEQRQLVRTQLQKTQTLLQQLLTRRQEVQQKVEQQRAQQQRQSGQSYTQRSSQTATSPKATGSKPTEDDLEAKFRRWELDAELEELKRSMGIDR
jgi:uncharacterized protein (TIGR04376 family)